MSAHDHSFRTIDGKELPLASFAGKPVLVVNVASYCGFTPQYKGLESVWQQYKDKGLVVLGFPCNQFGAQEPGSEAQIKQFCESRFRVDFPMFAKVDVNGPNAHPLYQWLKTQSGGADIGWNFAKFLVDGHGALVKRFAPTDTPESIEPAIEQLLK